MKFNCVIVDDSPLAIEVIQSFLKTFDMFELVASCSNASEVFSVLSSNSVDLIFLDIELPGMKGTDFLKNLVNPPKVIITTAYREYALEGFELNVVDFLLKPISLDRFTKAVSKFLQLSNAGLTRDNSVSSTQEKNDFIYVSGNKKVHKIKFDDIVYVESIRDYISIHTTDMELQVKYTISAFEKELPEKDFMRIHRSFIIALNHIKGFSANTVDMGLIEIPIGRNFHEHFFSRLKYKI